MELLILEPQGYPFAPNYRGTNRPAPRYRDDLPEDHPVNVLYRRYSEEGNESGIISDVEKAIDIVGRYAALNPPQRFEVVELTRSGAEPESGASDLLGYDLSTGGISLLEDQLSFPAHTSAGPHDPFSEMEPLFRLVERCYSAQLNKVGLFDSYDTAEACLAVMRVLNKLCPNAYENEATMAAFEVIGLWRVFSAPDT